MNLCGNVILLWDHLWWWWWCAHYQCISNGWRGVDDASIFDQRARLHQRRRISLPPSPWFGCGRAREMANTQMMMMTRDHLLSVNIIQRRQRERETHLYWGRGHPVVAGIDGAGSIPTPTSETATGQDAERTRKKLYRQTLKRGKCKSVPVGIG